MSCSACIQVATAETAEARAKLRQRLQRRTLAAVRAAGGAEGAGSLWLLALEALAAAGTPLGPLLDLLVAVCLGRAAGPLQVRRPPRVLIARHMTVKPLSNPCLEIPFRKSIQSVWTICGISCMWRIFEQPLDRMMLFVPMQSMFSYPA